MSDSVNLLDHGYLKVVEFWGSDERIIEAARMSTGKGFLGWEPGVCPTCEAVVFNSPMSEFNNKTVRRTEINTYVVCTDCNGTGKIPGDLGLLRRLWVKKHATPFEMAGGIFEVQAPIMVFREWHRHRAQSYNEMSARYTPLPDLNYVPTVDRMLMNQGTKNAQAAAVKGSDELTSDRARELMAEEREFLVAAERFYQKKLAAGVPKELARTHIGVSRYSRMRASANLRNWLGFLTLRMAEDAQWEIQRYAHVLHDLLKEKFPRTLELFDAGRN